jgi:plastocyanin
LSHRIKAVIAAAVAVLVVVPASASAATKDVNMGTPPSAGKSFEKALSDVNAFFPSSTTIHVGDSVRFLPVGFHNLDLPKKGGKPTALIAPQGGQTVTGANDAAGAPYWFNGQPVLGFNLPALAPVGFGKKFTYSGAKGVQSGLPLVNKPKPVTVKFTKAGSFTYYCDIHAGMKASVKVVSKSKSIPSAKADAKRVKEQVSKALALAKALPKSKAPAGTVDVGVAGKGGVEYFGMVPATSTVPVNTTLTFRMSPGTYEDHTATFGPGDPEKEPASFMGALAKTFEDPVPSPVGVYPSDPPGTFGTLNTTSHGNGFWNSGVMDGSSATPLPPSNKVTFTAPGTYTFYCLIHPFMKGSVVVQ